MSHETRLDILQRHILRDEISRKLLKNPKFCTNQTTLDTITASTISWLKNYHAFENNNNLEKGVSY